MEYNSIQKLNSLFHGCKSLRLLPNISCWNINNIDNLSYMFSECYSLEKLPKML